MDKRVSKALEDSIKHWEENALAKTHHEAGVGVQNCALCTLFFYNNPQCVGCPVQMATGMGRCIGTPYQKAADTYHLWYIDGSEKNSKAFHSAAKKEVKFLKSLRKTSS